MRQRYSIWGRDYFGSHDVEIVQVNTNPEAMKLALQQKVLSVKADKQHKPAKVARYSNLRIVDNG